MAENKGTKVIAPIVTPSTDDKYPTHISNMGKGGLHAVGTIEQRDAITAERREVGMFCSVVTDDGNSTLYQLVGGIENANWKPFPIGGDGTVSGPTDASIVTYTPSGELEGVNVQLAIDELEREKAKIEDVYKKSEVDTLIEGVEGLIENLEVDYNDLLNKPDLSSLHTHENKTALDKITETDGEITWDGEKLGDIIAGVYDTDGDGIVDKAKTLEGLTVEVSMLNYTEGLQGNIQEQLNTISDSVGSSDGSADSSTINISEVPYEIDDENSQSLKDIIDSLLYVAPVINTFTANPSVVEKGTTVNNLTLSWVINKTIKDQSINQGIGTLDNSLKTYSVTSDVKDNTTYTLTVSDDKNTVTKSASISFRSKMYYGVSSLTSLTSSDILTLNGELATSKAKSLSFNPNAQYIYVVFPASFGEPKFKVNGLDNDAWVSTEINHTNAQGFSENYKVYRSEFLQNGNGINIEIS